MRHSNPQHNNNHRNNNNNNNHHRRIRSRGNGGGNGSGGGGHPARRQNEVVSINKVYDSNGPDVRVRGTAAQIYDRYVGLARDAQAIGDRILAESYMQHAEHYLRVINAIQEQLQTLYQGMSDAIAAQPPMPSVPQPDDMDMGLSEESHQNLQPHRPSHPDRNENWRRQGRSNPNPNHREGREKRDTFPREDTPAIQGGGTEQEREVPRSQSPSRSSAHSELPTAESHSVPQNAQGSAPSLENIYGIRSAFAEGEGSQAPSETASKPRRVMRPRTPRSSVPVQEGEKSNLGEGGNTDTQTPAPAPQRRGLYARRTRSPSSSVSASSVDSKPTPPQEEE